MVAVEKTKHPIGAKGQTVNGGGIRFIPGYFQQELPDIPAGDIVVVFSISELAFGEAVRCFFDAHANEAAVIMCRVSIEAAVYAALSNRKVKEGEKEKMHQTYQLVKIKDWGILKRLAISQGFLTKEEFEDVDKNIREKGNFGAHWGQRAHKEGTWVFANSVGIEEAKDVMLETRKYAVLIIKRFFSKPAVSKDTKVKF